MEKNQRPIEPLNKGKLSCNKKILLSIISLATKEINGVSSLVFYCQNPFVKVFASKKFPGVKVAFEKNGQLTVDLYISVLSGFKVPDVAFRVQENVKNNVLSMLDMRVYKVNVHVVSVDFMEEKIN